jgi:hypothetical protein
MTEAEIKAQREKLTADLEAMKATGTSNATAIAAVQTTLADLNQKIAQLNLATNRASEGEHGESSFYTYVNPEHVKANAHCYVKQETGGNAVVRLIGHKTDRGQGMVFGLLDDPRPLDAAQRQLQVAAERRGLVRRILAAARKLPVDSPDIWTPRSDWEVDRALRGMPAPIAKIFANSSGIGSAFIPTRTSPEFEREVLAQNNMSSMFDVMDHPGGTLKLPYLSGHLQAFAKAVPSADDPANDTKSTLGDGEDSITVGHTAVAAQVDRDAEEDAILAILPLLNQDMALAMAFADDNTNVNGHTAGSQDALASWNVRGRLAVMTNNTAHQLRRWDGFRRRAIAASKSTTLNSAQTLAGLMTLINLLGIEQLMDSDGQSKIVILMNPEWFFRKGIQLADFSTYDKVGAIAAVLSGRIGSTTQFGLPNQVGYLYNRFPVCLCYTMTADLNASGVWDNTTTDRTGVVVVDRSTYHQWLRRGATVEQDVEIRNNTVTVVGRKRNVFRAKRVASTQAVAAYGFNLTLT